MMKFVYVDESGETESIFTHGRNTSLVFVQSAVIVDEKNWGYVNERIGQVKRKLFAQHGLPPQLELHTNKLIPRFKPFRDLEEDDVLNIVFELTDKLRKMPISVINTVRDKTINKHEKQCFNYNSKILIQRIETSMHKNYDGDTYILFPDKGYAKDWKTLIDQLKIKNNIPSMYNQEFYDAKIQKVIEDPIERDSKMTNLIQIADFYAYVISQYYLLKFMDRKPRKNLLYFDLDVIERILNSSLSILNTNAHNDNKYGIVHYPKRK